MSVLHNQVGNLTNGST